jgi:predicted AlkP superfamily pyrophosphatase or phosphodiesterase
MAALAAFLTIGCATQGMVAPKVLLIGLDGVRVDILAAAATPVIDSLIAGGYFSDKAITRQRTVSGPGWSSMLIGAGQDKHQVRNNDFRSNAYGSYPDFLTRLEQLDTTYTTLAVLDWPPLGDTTDGGPLISDAVDTKILIDGDANGYDRADSLSVAAAIEHLADPDLDAAFVYLGNIDVVGHETSSLAVEYRTAIETADRQVGMLIDALRRRPGYAAEDWLILLSTDHGRTDDGGHGGESLAERTIFYLASGPSVSPDPIDRTPHIVDVAVTALTHLRVEIDPAWGLDGKATGLQYSRR